MSLGDLSAGKERADEKGNRGELADDNGWFPLELELGRKISRGESGARVVEEDFFTDKGGELDLRGCVG